MAKPWHLMHQGNSLKTVEEAQSLGDSGGGSIEEATSQSSDGAQIYIHSWGISLAV
jgi:hypothetical protein